MTCRGSLTTIVLAIGIALLPQGAAAQTVYADGQPGVVGGHRDLHQATFDVDERAIGVGVRLMAATALAALRAGDAAASERLPDVACA